MNREPNEPNLDRPRRKRPVDYYDLAFGQTPKPPPPAATDRLVIAEYARSIEAYWANPDEVWPPIVTAEVFYALCRRVLAHG